MGVEHSRYRDQMRGSQRYQDDKQYPQLLRRWSKRDLYRPGKSRLSFVCRHNFHATGYTDK